MDKERTLNRNGGLENKLSFAAEETSVEAAGLSEVSSRKRDSISIPIGRTAIALHKLKLESEHSENSHAEEPEKQPTNLLVSLFQNFLFRFPFIARGETLSSNVDVKSFLVTEESSVEASRISEDGFEVSSQKPDTVRFPVGTTAIVLPQLKLESEHSEHSPAVLWQVYALGGYIVLKWLWGKYKERKSQNNDPDK